jgi:hypothetical protein
VTPEQFNEQYLNTKGEPVQRTLREMVAHEVMAAIDWHFRQAPRLKQEMASFADLVGYMNKHDGVPPGTTGETARRAAKALRTCGEAEIKAGRLLAFLSAAMPQWRHEPEDVGPGEAVRRYWRAA